MRGDGGGDCGVPANECRYIHHVTLRSNKLYRFYSIFNLCSKQCIARIAARAGNNINNKNGSRPCDILVGSRVSGGRVLLGGRPEWEERAHRRPSGLGEGGAPAATGTGSLGPLLRIRTTRSPENLE
jgi:hypothetical protein